MIAPEARVEGEITRGRFAPIGTLILLTMLAFSAWLASTQVQAVTVGVAPGNWFQYKINYSSGAHEISGADNFTVTVINVTGYEVGYKEVVNYSNQTIENETGYYNLTNGENTGTAWMLFRAGLRVGDPVYLGWPICINQSVTVDGRQSGYTHLVNAYVNITTGPKGHLSADIYGDNATGAVVNATMTLTDGNTTSLSYYLTATNAWTDVPEFSPTALIITVTTLTAITTAIAYRRKVNQP